MVSVLTLIASIFISFSAEANLDVPTPRALFQTGQVNSCPNYFWDRQRRHAGQEIDLSTRRPAVHLGNTLFSEKYGRPGRTLIGNFYHNGKFYIARIAPDSVQNVYFQLSYFPPIIMGNHYIAAHSLLRFEMAEGKLLELVAEMPSPAEIERIAALPEAERLAALPAELQGDEFRIRNLAISAEAQWVQGDPQPSYNLIRGLQDEYTQIVRFMSISDRFKEFYLGGNPIDQFRLDVTRTVGTNILRRGLELSERDGLDKTYNTLWYNCTTLAFDILEAEGTLQDHRLGFIREFIQRRVPVIATGILREYGNTTSPMMHLDPSLIEESNIGFMSLPAHVRTQNPPCAPGMSAANCRNIEAAVNLLRQHGLAPVNVEPSAWSGTF